MTEVLPDDLSDFERHLIKVNRRLKQRIDRMLGHPLPPGERGSGWELWAALMEDLREEGMVRLSVDVCEHVAVTYQWRGDR